MSLKYEPAWCRCNGLSYTMNYVDEAPKLDEVIEASDGTLPFPHLFITLEPRVE